MSSFQTCQVCHQQFSLKGPAPFLLPCLHSVCEPCVRSTAGGVISCSICQRVVNLTETRLQKDVITEKKTLHLTAQHCPELILCTHEEDGNQAVCWCKDCEDFLCENCQMIHSRFKITKHHIVEDIGDLQAGSFDVDEYCTIHPKYLLDTWDGECCILLCSKCKSGDHAKHMTIDFDEAVETARREVSDFRGEILSSVNQQGTGLTAMTSDLQTFDVTCDVLTEKISHTFNNLKTMLDQREKELKIELQQHHEKIRRELNEKKNTSEASQMKCQATSEYISETLQYSSRHDIMALRHILQSKTGECISSAQAIVYESPPLPRFITDGLEKIQSVLIGFGTITLKDDAEVAKGTNDCGSQTDDWLSSEREELTQELLQLRTAHEKEIQSMRETLSKVKSEEKKGMYILTTDVPDDAYLLNCISLEFSKTRYRTDKVHVNTLGELINKAQPYPTLSDQRLKNFEGTSSSFPIPQCGSTKYFEVKTKLSVDIEMPNFGYFLELGITREEEQDQHQLIGLRPYSYSLTVEHCPKHSSICRRVRRHGEDVLCLLDTFENTPGTSVTLHYGIVYDNVRSRIAFLDVKNEKIIGKINVNRSFALWPMFGVYNSYWTTIRMSLVVGSDIDITERKKALVLECLS